LMLEYWPSLYLATWDIAAAFLFIRKSTSPSVFRQFLYLYLSNSCLLYLLFGGNILMPHQPAQLTKVQSSTSFKMSSSLTESRQISNQIKFWILREIHAVKYLLPPLSDSANLPCNLRSSTESNFGKRLKQLSIITFIQAVSLVLRHGLWMPLPA
jgi:hypothetical protein